MGILVAGIAVKLGLVIIMLYYGLRLADEVVKQGNNAAERVTGWAGRALGSATYGLAGYGARNTIGGVSRTYAKNLQTKASTTTGVSGTRKLHWVHWTCEGFPGYAIPS
jgi:hypothetical protein